MREKTQRRVRNGEETIRKLQKPRSKTEWFRQRTRQGSKKGRRIRKRPYKNLFSGASGPVNSPDPVALYAVAMPVGNIEHETRIQVASSIFKACFQNW